MGQTASRFILKNHGWNLQFMLKKSHIAAALLVAGSTVAHAQSQWCQGTVDRIWIDHHGTVFVVPSWRGDHIRICNLKGNDGRTDTVVCSTWYSQLSQAVKDSRVTTIYYEDIVSCAQIPTYANAPVPYYVMLHK